MLSTYDWPRLGRDGMDGERMVDQQHGRGRAGCAGGSVADLNHFLTGVQRALLRLVLAGGCFALRPVRTSERQNILSPLAALTSAAYSNSGCATTWM